MAQVIYELHIRGRSPGQLDTKDWIGRAYDDGTVSVEYGKTFMVRQGRSTEKSLGKFADPAGTVRSKGQKKLYNEYDLVINDQHYPQAQPAPSPTPKPTPKPKPKSKPKTSKPAAKAKGDERPLGRFKVDSGLFK